MKTDVRPDRQRTVCCLAKLASVGLEEVWLIVMILEKSKVFAKYPWELTFQMNDQTAALVQFLRRLF